MQPLHGLCHSVIMYMSCDYVIHIIILQCGYYVINVEINTIRSWDATGKT